jgi:hypothetical protein
MRSVRIFVTILLCAVFCVQGIALCAQVDHVPYPIEYRLKTGIRFYGKTIAIDRYVLRVKMANGDTVEFKHSDFSKIKYKKHPGPHRNYIPETQLISYKRSFYDMDFRIITGGNSNMLFSGLGLNMAYNKSVSKSHNQYFSVGSGMEMIYVPGTSVITVPLQVGYKFFLRDPVLKSPFVFANASYNLNFDGDKTENGWWADTKVNNGFRYEVGLGFSGSHDRSSAFNMKMGFFSQSLNIVNDNGQWGSSTVEYILKRLFVSTSWSF